MAPTLEAAAPARSILPTMVPWSPVAMLPMSRHMSVFPFKLVFSAGVILPHRGHLATSADIFKLSYWRRVCYLCHVEKGCPSASYSAQDTSIRMIQPQWQWCQGSEAMHEGLPKGWDALISLPRHLGATSSLSVVDRIHDKVKNEKKDKAVLHNSEATKTN